MAHSTPVEQEPSTSSGLVKLRRGIGVLDGGPLWADDVDLRARVLAMHAAPPQVGSEAG
jgi:hypothetical protein